MFCTWMMFEEHHSLRQDDLLGASIVPRKDDVLGAQMFHA